MKFVLQFFLLWATFLTQNPVDYLVFEEKGKVGLKDRAGKILIPPHYESIGWSHGDFFLMNNVTGYRTGGKWGLINTGNKRITKAEYNTLLPGKNDLLIAEKKVPVSAKAYKGCINLAGKEVIPFMYDGIILTSAHAVVFTKIGNQFRYGLIDHQNKTLIPQQFQEIEPLSSSLFSVRNFDGKTAIFNAGGKVLSGFTIDSVRRTERGFVVVSEGVKKGLLDSVGSTRLEIRYREIIVSRAGSVRFREADEWILLNGKNEILKQVRADSLVGLGKNRYKLKTDAASMMVNGELNPVGESVFTDLSPFNNGRAIYKLGALAGVVSPDGSVLVPALYSGIIFAQGYILASTRGAVPGWILFDSTGVRRSSRSYEAISMIAPGVFSVKSRNAWGLLKAEGREVVPCTYDSLLQYHEGLLVVKFHGTYGVITTSEDWKVRPGKNKPVLLNNDRYIERNGPGLVLKSIERGTLYFTTNPVTVFKEYIVEELPTGERWKIDLNGVIADRAYIPSGPAQEELPESEGLKAVKRNGRYGFVDSRGRLRIANRYEAVKPFREGMAAVKILGKWGFINVNDNIAVQPTSEFVESFYNGYALVRQKGFWGLIDKTGKAVLPVRYAAIERLSSGNLRISAGKKFGLADASGSILIQPKYDFLEDCGNGFAIIKKDQRYGVMSYDGLSTVPLIHEHISFDRFHGYFLALKRSEWMQLQL